MADQRCDLCGHELRDHLDVCWGIGPDADNIGCCGCPGFVPRSSVRRRSNGPPTDRQIAYALALLTRAGKAEHIPDWTVLTAVEVSDLITELLDDEAKNSEGL